MKISENFTLEELYRSCTADSIGIDNKPTDKVKNNLIILTKEILQPIRNEYGKPVIVSSGYRCEKLNKAVGGSSTSAHVRGEAADLTTSNMKEFQRCVLEWAKTNKFDQIIIEYPNKGFVATWIHIGSYNAQGKQRKQIIYTNDGKHYYNVDRRFYV